MIDRGMQEQIFAQPLVYTPPSGERQYVYIASQVGRLWVGGDGADDGR